jgi:hypothetical protein
VSFRSVIWQFLFAVAIAGAATLPLACDVTPCNTETCSDGCCSEDGRCYVGGSDSYCGLGGNACESCWEGSKTCVSGVCRGCDPVTCPNGCCTTSGFCETNVGDYACGAGGGACTSCATNQACRSGACTACSSYGSPCTSSAQCCSNLTCQFDSFDSRDECDF